MKTVDGEVDAVDGLKPIGATRCDWVVRDLPYLEIGWHVIGFAKQRYIECVSDRSVGDFKSIEDVDQTWGATAEKLPAGG